ncbi:hypothetical protein N0V84_012194 [Fusarium piperis]|uniref:Aminoglycoside phosphotransferase domain-containing protein n=1 Tax=Fusarium piperis TaxID=1435070 RepID=A0A9W8TAQ0_9HYPO|nr:hypothetical protein N0V84_012194 [Fusarium piperis]
MGTQLYPTDLPQYVHFHRTFRQVNERTWIVGGRLLISLLDSAHDVTSWPVGQGVVGWYHASEAPNPRPRSSPIRDGSRFKLLRHWQEEGAMWQIGQCVLRVQLRVGVRDTKEADTLRALQGRMLSLQVPVVYADFEFDGYEYIIYEKPPGVPLNKVWSSLDTDEKNSCAQQVARFCRELAAFERDRVEGVGGVNGSYMRDAALLHYHWQPDNTPQTMFQNCVDMGLDCSRLVFTHNFLFPHNVIFNCAPGANDGRVVGVEDWTHAGFVPEGWIRAGFVLYDDNDLGDGEWQRMIHSALSDEEFSFPDGEALMAWKEEREGESSIFQSQYWATMGRERRLNAERLILDATKPSENPGISSDWDNVQPEGNPHMTFPVTFRMALGSFYYPRQ